MKKRAAPSPGPPAIKPAWIVSDSDGSETVDALYGCL
jgi:hypothetical protein